MNALLLLLWTSLLMKPTLQGSMQFRPDQSQFFHAARLMVRCDDRTWKVWRRSNSSSTTSCGDLWGMQSSPWCIVKYLKMEDSRQYWCQSAEGSVTESYSISVADRGVILQAPLLPVSSGRTVDLICLSKNKNTLPARFHRDGLFLSAQPTQRLTLQPVALSDEGQYTCEIDGERSPASLLRVKPVTPTSPPAVTSAPRPSSPDPLVPEPSPAPALPLFVVPLVGSILGVILLIVVVLVVLLVRRCRCRKTKGSRKKRRRGKAARNTGQRNTGQRNTGQQNTGQQNTGQQNTGQQNTGQCRHHKMTKK